MAKKFTRTKRTYRKKRGKRSGRYKNTLL